MSNNLNHSMMYDADCIFVRCFPVQKELLAKAEKDYLARKAEVLHRMKTTKNGTFTPAELALVENSDDDEGEAEIQQLISDRKGGDSSNSAAVTVAEEDLRAHVNLPSQEDINELLLAEKRKQLLAKLSSL